MPIDISQSTWEYLARYTLENSFSLVFWVRTDSTFAFVSQAMLDALGYTKEEIDKLNVTDILVGFEEIDRDKLRKRIDNKKHHVVRVSLQKKNGGTIAVESQNNSIEFESETFNVAFCKKIFEEKNITTVSGDDHIQSVDIGGPSLYEVCDQLGIIGSSRKLIETLNLASGYARTSRSLLIKGETGVGKESLAHLVHLLSGLREASFLRINCSTITDDLAISNLFGHVKGAFTGAVNDHDGIFARAEGGTVFLDEVGELPLRVQAMLLRILQNGEYTKLGGTKVLKSNVRIIAATNRDLKQMIKQKLFREDLYHRLGLLRLVLPPLRERTGDLSILVRHRLAFLNKTECLEREMPSQDDMKVLESYHFPGNIRELFGLIERAYFDGSVGPLEMTEELIGVSGVANQQGGVLLSHRENERRHILRVLTHCKWKVGGKGGAAEILGVPRSTLLSKMEKLGIDRDRAILRRIGA